MFIEVVKSPSVLFEQRESSNLKIVSLSEDEKEMLRLSGEEIKWLHTIFEDHVNNFARNSYSWECIPLRLEQVSTLLFGDEAGVETLRELAKRDKIKTIGKKSRVYSSETEAIPLAEALHIRNFLKFIISKELYSQTKRKDIILLDAI